MFYIESCQMFISCNKLENLRNSAVVSHLNSFSNLYCKFSMPNLNKVANYDFKNFTSVDKLLEKKEKSPRLDIKEHQIEVHV
jgi:hypothetical protein